MTNPEDRNVVRRLGRLAQIEPSRKATELAIEHARAVIAGLPAATVSQSSESARPRNPRRRSIARLTMRQRIAVLGGVGLAAVLGVVLLWAGMDAKPVSAMEKMAECVRRARSFKSTGVTKETFVINAGEPGRSVEKTIETRMTNYWLAPDSVRLEITHLGTSQGPEPEKVNIVPGKGRPWMISIDHRAKTFRVRKIRDNDVEKSFFPDQLGRFAGKADRELGTKEFHGKKARGFVIGIEKIDPRASPSRKLEIWLDSETNLPAMIRAEEKTERGLRIMESTGIQWNIDLDPKLFDPTPPEGYKDLTPKAPTSGDPLREITEALRLWARPPVEQYPRMKQQVGVNDVETLLSVLDILRSKWEQGEAPFKAASAERVAREVERLAKQREGFLHLWTLVDAGRDVAYYGNTVGPKDHGRVLLRWKLDDGRYQVLFGDLHAEVVTAERLRALEGK